MSDRAPQGDSHEATRATRGVVFIALAKFYFMVAGAVIELRLPAVLTNTVFGAYGVVAATVSPLNNVLITGTIQAISRFTSPMPERARAVQATGFRMHLFVGLPVAVIFIAAAPLLAAYFEDEAKTAPLRLAGLISAAYAMYAVFVGTINGCREFGKQAALDVAMATLRAAGIVGLASAGLGLMGALGGWVGAAAAMVAIAALVVGVPRRSHASEPRTPVVPMARFFLAVAVFLVLLNLIMSVDQLLLKRLTTQWFVSHGAAVATALGEMTPDRVGTFVPAEAADGQVGYYRAVQNLARLSYQVMVAVTFVVFPLVSRSTFARDRAATARYVATTMRYSFVLAAAMAVVFAANPRPVLDIFYPADYAYFGGDALAVLALGNVAFSVFAVAGAILNGAGLTRQATLTAAVTLAVAVALNAIVIPRLDPGREVLRGCAAATSAAMITGALLGGWFLRRHLGAFLPLGVFCRVLLAGLAAGAVGRVLPLRTPLAALGEAAVVALTFVAALIALRELGRRDLEVLAALKRLGRSRPGPGE